MPHVKRPRLFPALATSAAVSALGRISVAAFIGLCIFSGTGFAQTADFRGSQTGIEDPATPPPPPLVAPILDEAPGAAPPPRVKPAPKRPPQLPPLAAYQTYPPASAQGRAARKTTGPAKPLPTTGLPPMPLAAGQRRPVDKLLPNPAPPPTAAAIPAPQQAKTAASALGPYDPVGVDIGEGLRLYPYVESDVGYDTNPTQATSGSETGSGLARIEGGAKVKSDWSRHALTADLKAGYTDYFKVHSSSHPDVSFNASGRIDVERDTDINIEGHFNFSTQRNAQTIAGVTSNVSSGIYDSGVAAGITHRFGRLATTLRGSIDRLSYANPTLGGTTLNLSGGNYTGYELRGRAAYEITPGFAPYIQASVDTRKHDSKVDSNGYARDSNGASLRIGTTYELTRTLTAEANIGIGTRDYADTRLKTHTGPVADLSLQWQATPLTTFTLKGTSTQDETSLTGASGIWDTKISLQAEHALLRNLTLSAGLAYQNNKYTGTSRADHLTTGTLAANYSVNRDIVLRGSYTFTHQGSSDIGSRYTDHVFLLGLKLQH